MLQAQDMMRSFEQGMNPVACLPRRGFFRRNWKEHVL